MKTIRLFLLTAVMLAACNPATPPAPLPQPRPAAVTPAIPTLTGLPPTSMPVSLSPTATPLVQRASPIDGMPQVYIPAGRLRMGGLDVFSDRKDELPVHDVTLDAFCSTSWK